ncbi:hypothetical protein ACFVYJ_05355 [Pontibacter sp. JAM-7]|uniref:hypothetical protein n=1 Tax=Pontibacter sp. JAM-7 TaxID=3366581 RepID=UPI003AF53A85
MVHRWRKDTAYLHTWIYQDLMGDWIITRCWGDTCSGNSQARHKIAGSLPAARQELKRIARRCRHQGYQPYDSDETQLGFEFPDF